MDKRTRDASRSAREYGSSRPSSRRSGNFSARIRALLSRGGSRLGLSLSDYQLGQLVIQLQELGRWAEKLSLTGYQTDRARAIYLTLDSMLLVPLLPATESSLLDIGSGTGFPGVVIKVLRPSFRVSLVEGNRKRAHFLKHLVRCLNLEHCDVLAERTESIRSVLASRFDCVTLRSIGPPERAFKLASPFIRPGGTLLLALGPTSLPPKLPTGWSHEILSIRLPFSPIERRILRIHSP